MVEVTHCQFQNEHAKRTVQPTLVGKDSAKSATNGENRTNHDEAVIRPSALNKVEILQKIRNKKQSVAVKKKVLILNSNTNQSKEVRLHIEKRGRNIRCKVDGTDHDANGESRSADGTKAANSSTSNDEDSATESVSEPECIDSNPNYPSQDIKMEEELIIIDDDSCESMHETHSHNETATDDNQQPDDMQHNQQPPSDDKKTTCHICFKSLRYIKLHRIRFHNMCVVCEQTFHTSTDLKIHRLQCIGPTKRKPRNTFCNLCEKNFHTSFILKEHLRTVHDPHYKKQLDKINTANEVVFKKWASLISDT